MSRPTVDVLVVGAGTTGLSLALQAQAHGARVRIVERRSELSRPSRAMMMHPRTLEVLRPLSVVPNLLARGDSSARADVHLGPRVTIPVQLSRFDLPTTAFPHLLLIRQADVEAVLAEALRQRGIAIELGVELTGIRREAGHDPIAVLDHGGDREEVPCRFLAGCDGAGSTVRALTQIGWRGKQYDREVVLADVDIQPPFPPGTAQVSVDARGLVFLFPIGERAPWRLLATRPAPVDRPPSGQPDRAVPTAELQHLLDRAKVRARITRVAWSAQIQLQSRLASRFRSGRVFLAGDAAHVHSPAGGQGMNAGIQDAANLGWKLAFAARAAGGSGASRDALLHSYECERRPADRRVLALTHLLFWAESATGPLVSFGRGVVAPLAAPAMRVALHRPWLVRVVMRQLSQFPVRYRRSPLSRAPGLPCRLTRLAAGDRLPDGKVVCDGRVVRIHQLTETPGIHVFLHRDAPALASAAAGVVHVHRLSNWKGTGLMVVRPDGYVGLRSEKPDRTVLDNWLSLVGVPVSGLPVQGDGSAGTSHSSTQNPRPPSQVS